MKVFEEEKQPKPFVPDMGEPVVFSPHPGQGWHADQLPHDSGCPDPGSKNSAPVVADLASKPILQGERSLSY